jgi:hypothetical protein
MAKKLRMKQQPQKPKVNVSKKNQKKEEKEKLLVDLDFSLCDFPLPYSDAELTKNWFDFDDSTVTPIMPGTLQKMFGGSSANAYMLVYRQRAVKK